MFLLAVTDKKLFETGAWKPNLEPPGAKQMIKTRICPECGLRLTKVVEAIRGHEAHMVLSLKLNGEGDLTEELRQRLSPEVVVSFNAARLAWGAYCRHLDGHGLLKPALKGEVAGIVENSRRREGGAANRRDIWA